MPTVEIEVDIDAFMQNDGAEDTYGEADFCAVEKTSGSQYRRSLSTFSWVESPVPVGNHLVSATMRRLVTSRSGTGTVQVLRSLSGIDYPLYDEQTVTWNTRNGVDPWSEPGHNDAGVDFATSPNTSFSIPGSTGQLDNDVTQHMAAALDGDETSLTLYERLLASGGATSHLYWGSAQSVDPGPTVLIVEYEEDAVEPELPTVTTSEVSSITSTTAVSGGEVTDDGGAEILERGVCWNTTGSPTIADAHTSDGTGTGTFESILSSLTMDEHYYVRALSRNIVGTAYGNEVEFDTITKGGGESGGGGYGRRPTRRRANLSRPGIARERRFLGFS